MYTDFFKLAKKPFQLTPSATVFYQNTQVEQCYSKLLTGIQKGQELILLTGEQGTGKTLFAQKLQADLQEDPSCQCINLSFTSLSLDEMLEYICGELELSYGLGRNEDSFKILETFLTRGASPVKSVLIIIDEAQNLTTDILDCLLSLIKIGADADAERSVQMVLLARNEQAMKFDQPERAAFKKKISLHSQIQAFPPENVEGYIEYQLQQAGSNDTKIFTPETCARIFQYTAGSPRAINLLCDQVLAMAAHDGIKTITPEQVDSVHRQVEFEDTLETRTSLASGAIAQMENLPDTGETQTNHQTSQQTKEQKNKPADQSENKPGKRSGNHSNIQDQQPARVSVTEPDTRPEPETPEIQALAEKLSHYENNTASHYASTNSSPAKNSQTVDKHPWQNTETQTNELSHEVAVARPFSKDRSIKLKLSWIMLIALISVLAILGLLYSQLQFQKDTIEDLEKKLVDVNKTPVEEKIVVVQEKTVVPPKKPTPPMEPATPVKPTSLVKPEMPVEKEQSPPADISEETIVAKEVKPAVTQDNSDKDKLKNEVVKMETQPEIEPQPQPQLTITDPDAANKETTQVEQTAIEKLHSKIPQQIANEQLTEPKGDNAIETYQTILELDPDNQQAKEGITRIKENFIRWAKSSEKKAQWQRARYQYGKAQLIDPYDEELKEMIEDLDKQLSPSDRGVTLTIVLEYARTGNTKDMTELLEKGAFVDMRDKSGNTALMLATDHGHIGAVDTLLTHEADVNLANKIGDTALMNAVWSNHHAIAELLISQNAKVNAINKHGWTALTYAAIHGYTSLFKTLIDAGATSEQRTKDGKTPLAAAAHNGQRKIVSLLLKKGTKIDAKDNEDWTPLMHAVWNNHTTVVQLLLLNNAKVNNQNNEGWTPLMLAAWNGFDTIVEMLLENGADKSVMNNKGNLALDLARRQHHQDIVDLLQ